MYILKHLYECPAEMVTFFGNASIIERTILHKSQRGDENRVSFVCGAAVFSLGKTTVTAMMAKATL